MTLFAPNLLAETDYLSHVVDHPLVKTEGGWWIVTNHMVMMIVTALIMLAIFPLMAKRYVSGKYVPTGSANFFETILQYIRNDVINPLLGDETDRFIPYLWTLFFFVLISNILGLIPIDVLTGFGMGLNHGHGIFGTSTSNIYVTAILALISFLVIQYNGIKENGVGGWMHHFLGGAPVWLAPVMVPVEIMGMIIKPCALAIRLAANMTAGHILLGVIISFVFMAWEAFNSGSTMHLIGRSGIGVVSVVASIAIMCLELFVALLQAYLFTFLTALFISQLLHHEHDEAHHEAEADEFGMTHADREHDAFHKPAH